MTVHMLRFMLVVKAKLSAGNDQQMEASNILVVWTLFKTDPPTNLGRVWILAAKC